MRRTARAYRTESEVFPSMGHDLMLDVGWQAVADRIDTWIPETAVSNLERGPLTGSAPENYAS